MKTERLYMRKTVLFDLDDTLYPELSFVKSGYRSVAVFLTERYQPKLKDDKRIYEELMALFYENPKRVFNRYLEACNIPFGDREIRELVDCYRKHEPDIVLYPDALQTLFRLRDLGCDLGIISDGYHVSQRNKLNALFNGRLNLFGRIILTDELGRGYSKPDERSFLMVKEYFKTDWSDMVYVGDNPAKDFYIGNEHPILTIRIKKPGTVYEGTEYLEGVREKLMISELSELYGIIKRS